MNIVKFKDIILNEENAPQLTEAQRTLFNEKYRGRYTYAVDFAYIVALEDMTQKQYVDASKNLLDDEFGNVYTLINGVDDIRNNEGIIDDTKEYFLLSTNKYNSPDEIHTYIPGTHGLGAKQSSTYTDFIDIPNFDFLNDDNTPKNKFIVNTEIDRQITAKTNYRLLPYKYYVQGAQEQETVEETFSMNTGSGYTYNITIAYQLEQNYFDLRIETNTEHKYSYSIIIKNDYDERNFGGGASALGYFTRIYLDHDDPNINMQYFDTIHISISDKTGAKESNTKVHKSYWDTDPDYFYIQDRQYEFTPEKEKEQHKLDWNYYYVNKAGTSSSNRNLIYNDGEFCEDRLKEGGSILGQWHINEEKLLTNIQGDAKLIFNAISPRFDMYGGTSQQMYPAYLYRRDVIEPTSLEDFDYILFDLIKDYVDSEPTVKANSVVKYIEANSFHPDDNITIEELKNFRWWLAHELIELNDETEERYDVIEMLRYYEQNMYDDTVKHLSTFTPKTSVDVLTATNRSTCGCQGGTGVNTLASGLTVCDPIYTYRKAVYEKMVDTFSSVDFWKEQPVIFLEEFKKYIDGIIKMNFPLYTVKYISDLYDCGCLSNAESTQARLIGYLKNLSQSLGYMIADDMSSHKNFIGDSFNKWASYLYEKMSWI